MDFKDEYFVKNNSYKGYNVYYIVTFNENIPTRHDSLLAGYFRKTGFHNPCSVADKIIHTSLGLCLEFKQTSGLDPKISKNSNNL